MTLVLYLLGRSLWGPDNTSPFHHNMERNRLRKKSRRKNIGRSIYSCKDIFDVIRAQSCLTIIEDDDDEVRETDRGGINKAGANTKTRPHVGFLLDEKKIIPSESSLSNYSVEDEMEEPEQPMRRRPKTPVFAIGQLSHHSSNNIEVIKRRARSKSPPVFSINHLEYPSIQEIKEPIRRRAKTPVFAIGQLERKSTIRPIDKSQILADQYKEILPPRAFTPCADQRQIKRLTPKKLRKIKCQVSLRDLVRDQAKLSSPTTAYSDAETLVGSESPPTSPLSQKFKDIDKDILPLARTKKTQSSIQDDGRTLSTTSSDFSNDIALKITIDLLTNELATALFKHHPAEISDRASGLQILLMIEAYETVQQHVRQRIWDRHVKGMSNDHVQDVEDILERWLKVLYSVYDRTQESGSAEECAGKIEIADEWPLRKSLDMEGLTIQGE
jgi:hypothetical protein